MGSINNELVRIIVKLLVAAGVISAGERYTVKELIEKANEYVDKKLE